MKIKSNFGLDVFPSIKYSTISKFNNFIFNFNCIYTYIGIKKYWYIKSIGMETIFRRAIFKGRDDYILKLLSIYKKGIYMKITVNLLYILFYIIILQLRRCRLEIINIFLKQIVLIHMYYNHFPIKITSK